jgi:hypothetical protein
MPSATLETLIHPIDERERQENVLRNMVELQLECTLLKLLTLAPGVARSRENEATTPAVSAALRVQIRVANSVANKYKVGYKATP